MPADLARPTEHDNLIKSRNLEIQVVDHCNLDCLGCSHDSPTMPPRGEDPGRLARTLSALWQYYRSPLVKLLGGEPLVHPRISEIIRVVKTETHAKVRLVTNGKLLAKRSSALGEVDEVHISVYPHVNVPSDGELVAIAKQLGLSITLQQFNSFRWVRGKQRGDDHLTERVYATCQMVHSWQCHTLRNGWIYPCPPAGTWGAGAQDGVSLLDDCESLRERLRALLHSSGPFHTCKSCLGSVGARYPHRLGARSVPHSLHKGEVDFDFLRVLEKTPEADNSCFQYLRTILPNGDIVPGLPDDG